MNDDVDDDMNNDVNDDVNGGGRESDVFMIRTRSSMQHEHATRRSKV